jgi:hypothetical protein
LTTRPAGPVWWVTKGHAEHGLGELLHLVDRPGELDAAALAAAAGMDLRLDDPDRAAQFARRTLGLGGGVGHLALQHGHAVLGQELLGLVFVDVHRSSFRA